MPLTKERKERLVREIRGFYAQPAEQIRDFAQRQLAEVEKAFAEIRDLLGAVTRRYSAIERNIDTIKTDLRRGDDLAGSTAAEEQQARKRCYVMAILNGRTAAEEIDSEKILGHTVLLAIEAAGELASEAAGKVADAAGKAGESASSLVVPLAIGAGVVVAGVVVAAVAMAGSAVPVSVRAPRKLDVER